MGIASGLSLASLPASHRARLSVGRLGRLERRFAVATTNRASSKQQAGSRRQAAALPPDSGAVTTPHSGCHWDGTDRRFFEGWYWRITLPGDGQSFALIYSIEDPLGNSPGAGVGAQVMGPGVLNSCIPCCLTIPPVIATNTSMNIAV